MKADKYLESIMKDIDKKVEKATEETSKVLLQEIERAYENSIDDFYADYIPKVYQRTESTYRASSGFTDGWGVDYGRDNFKFLGDNTYEVGIRVGAENIEGHPYRADTDWVFNRTYYRGIHGRNRTDKTRDLKKKKFTPFIGKAKKDSKRNIYISKGMGHTYEISVKEWRHFRSASTSIKNMTPPPQKVMSKRFTQIKKRNHCNDVFTEMVDRYVQQEF